MVEREERLELLRERERGGLVWLDGLHLSRVTMRLNE